MKNMFTLYSKNDFFNYEFQQHHTEWFERSEKDQARFCEMSPFDNAFLFGLISQRAPQKIVEVGVASGGTTTMLMEYITKYNPSAKLSSVDFSEDLWWDRSRKTGFLALDRYRDHKNWDFFVGDILPSFLPKISKGKDIDFCVLDTAHCLPGEMLDFLSILPFLKDGAVLVLHDVQLPLITNLAIQRTYFCNKVLFDSAVGDKIVCPDPSKISGLPNISALVITPDTRKYINNIFSAIAMPWEYIPGQDHIDKYADWYKICYGDGYYEYFLSVVQAQKEALEKYRKQKQSEDSKPDKTPDWYRGILKDLYSSAKKWRVRILLRMLLHFHSY